MAEPSDINEALEQVAFGPKRSKEAGRELEEHDLDQLIRFDNHMAAKNAGRLKNRGLRFSKIVPPGCG